jgi:membrane protease YdiL (CAAX protease family)
MPAIAAVVLTALVEGKAAVRTLLARFKVWQIPAKWWLTALLVYPVLLAITAILYRQTGCQPALAVQTTTVPVLIINLVTLAIATLGEETGWRGVAMPGLQRRHAPVPASLILGFLWATWHLPFWMLMDTYDQFGMGYITLNYLFIVFLTVYMTWLFNHTRSSLLIASIFHYTFNIVNVVFLPVTSTPGSYLFFIALQGFVVSLVILLQKNTQTNHSE